MTLNMRLSVWITFWIFVISDHLLTNPLSIQVMDFDIDNLKEIICETNTTFYTPTNVKSECITAALDCVIREFIGVAKHECEDPTKKIDPELEVLNITLEERPDRHELNKSSACACERWPQTPFLEFLKSIKDLLEFLNSQNYNLTK